MEALRKAKRVRTAEGDKVRERGERGGLPWIAVDGPHRGRIVRVRFVFDGWDDPDYPELNEEERVEVERTRRDPAAALDVRYIGDGSYRFLVLGRRSFSATLKLSTFLRNNRPLSLGRLVALKAELREIDARSRNGGGDAGWRETYDAMKAAVAAVVEEVS